MEVDDAYDDVSEGELFGEEEDRDVPVLEEARIRDRIRGVAAGAVLNVRLGARAGYMDYIVETNLAGETEDRLTRFLSTDDQLEELYLRLNERVETKVEVPQPKYKIARDRPKRLLRAIMDLRLQRIKEQEAARPDEEVAAMRAAAAAARKRKAKAQPPQPPYEVPKSVQVTAMPGARQMALLHLAEDAADYRRLGARYEAGDKALKKDVSLAMVACADPPEDKPEEVEKAIRQTLLFPVGKLADNAILERNRALYERVPKPSNGDATHVYWAANADAHEEFDAFKYEWPEATQRAFLAKFVRLTWGENPDYKDDSNAGVALTPDEMLQECSGSRFPMHAFVLQKVRAAFIEKHHSKLLLRLAASLKDAPPHQLEAVLEAIQVKTTNQFAKGTAEHLTFNEKLKAYKFPDDTLKKHTVVHREVGLKLKDFPELLEWALETISMDAAELKARREAYKSVIHPRHNEVRALVDAWLRRRESIPAPKRKGFNGDLVRPTGERAKENAAEAAAEREEAVQAKRKKQAAARAQIEEAYPHFGEYASEVFFKPQRDQKKKAAQAVVARMMRTVMHKVRRNAHVRDAGHKRLVALNVRVEQAKRHDQSDFDPQGAEFSDDDDDDDYWEARAAAKRARRARALYSAPAPLVPVREPAPMLFAPRSPSPERVTGPSEIAAIEEQMDRYAKQPRLSSMTAHEKANVQKLMADLERRLPKGHKRKAADSLDLAGR
jgi:hypothetical protein